MGGVQGCVRYIDEVPVSILAKLVPSSALPVRPRATEIAGSSLCGSLVPDISTLHHGSINTESDKYACPVNIHALRSRMGPHNYLICQNAHMRRDATWSTRSQLRYVVKSLTAYNELAHESNPLAKQALPEGPLLRYG